MLTLIEVLIALLVLAASVRGAIWLARAGLRNRELHQPWKVDVDTKGGRVIVQVTKKDEEPVVIKQLNAAEEPVAFDMALYEAKAEAANVASALNSKS